ncbi:MAG: peroxiredoxin [Candidatus Thermoplasmatota archaeon]|nr:peroxiredoxin [Candidatus Thermoplasmatota archaeon]
MTELKMGDRAPDFSLLDEKGNKVRLNDFIGKKKVVLYFYPMDFTPRCTTEACSFRDSYKIFESTGAVVLGVGLGTVESHAKFSQKYNLPFRLLSDSTKETARSYGVLGIGSLMAKRVTFIISKDGKIAHVFPNVDIITHVGQIIKTLEEMK